MANSLTVLMDSNQELRAMILCALPYPPLPVSAKRFEEGNRLGDSTVISTHDIISQLLEAACVQKRLADNAQRMYRQMAVMDDLYTALNQVQDPSGVYSVYCKYSAGHIATYFPIGCAPELRFMPLDYCCRGDQVHKKLCEYMDAQIILEQSTVSTTTSLHDMPFPSLIALNKERWLASQGMEDSSEPGSCAQALVATSNASPSLLS